MEYFIKSGRPEKQRIGCAVVGIFEYRKLSDHASKLNEASGGWLRAVMRRGDMDGRLGQTLVLHNTSDVLFCDRILLVGCGREQKFNEYSFRVACQAAGDALQTVGGVDASFHLTELNIRNQAEDYAWSVKHALLYLEERLYRFDEYKSLENQGYANKLSRIIFQVPRRHQLTQGEKGLNEGLAVAVGKNYTKDLVNTPSNICTPAYLADQARQLADKHDAITTQVLEASEAKELGLKPLLKVSYRSQLPVKLITIEYMNGGQEKPIVLIGEGRTFDIGSCEPDLNTNTPHRKYGMSGAASVLGVIKAASVLDLPVNLIVVIPAFEASLGAQPYKVGDIITSSLGPSIEINDADVEGQLILAEALAYADQQYDAEAVIDVSTLNDVADSGLGHHLTPLYGNHSPLQNALFKAGKGIGDYAWHMPLLNEYQEGLESNVADMSTACDSIAGSITIACFLSNFGRNLRWAHLDVSGSAWRYKEATGRPVGLLVQYLIDRVE